jgi:hypothetical protein
MLACSLKHEHQGHDIKVRKVGGFTICTNAYFASKLHIHVTVKFIKLSGKLVRS